MPRSVCWLWQAPAHFPVTFRFPVVGPCRFLCNLCEVRLVWGLKSDPHTGELQTQGVPLGSYAGLGEHSSMLNLSVCLGL